MTTTRGPIGIVSGLGPLAGSDVLAKALQHAARRYGAVEDADYPDVVLCSHGIDTFDETGSTDAGFEHELIRVVQQLELHHPSVVGLACNTAHLHLDRLREHTAAVFIDLIDEVVRVASTSDERYLLLSSSMTRRTRLYHRRLEQHAVSFVDVDDAQQEAIDEVVHLVMGRQLEIAGAQLRLLVHQLDPHSFSAIIAGCTELPLAVDQAGLRYELPIIDSNQVLARALVDTYYAQRDAEQKVTLCSASAEP